MRIIDIFSTANTNLRRSKMRTFLTVLAISIGTFTLAMSLGLGEGIRSYISSQLGDYAQSNIYQVVKSGSREIANGGAFGNNEPVEYNPEQTKMVDSIDEMLFSKNDIDKLSNLDGVTSVEFNYMPKIDYALASNGKKYELSSSVFITGQNMRMVAGSNFKEGSAGEAGQVLLSRKFISLVGVNSSEEAVGKKININYTNYNGEKITESMIIQGLFEPTLLDTPLVFNQSDARRIASSQTPSGTPISYAVFALKADNITDEQFKQNLSDANFEANSLADVLSVFNNLISGIQLGLAAFSSIAILAAVVGVINTLFMAILERTREIGLFRALGAKKRTIFALFSVEAALLGFWGSVVGIGFAFLAQLAINNYAESTFLKGFEGLQLINITPLLIISIVTIMALITLIAGLLPAIKASRLDPIEALRYE